jgi:hypothetical protein
MVDGVAQLLPFEMISLARTAKPTPTSVVGHSFEASELRFEQHHVFKPDTSFHLSRGIARFLIEPCLSLDLPLTLEVAAFSY